VFYGRTTVDCVSHSRPASVTELARIETKLTVIMQSAGKGVHDAAQRSDKHMNC